MSLAAKKFISSFFCPKGGDSLATSWERHEFPSLGVGSLIWLPLFPSGSIVDIISRTPGLSLHCWWQNWPQSFTVKDVPWDLSWLPCVLAPSQGSSLFKGHWDSSWSYRPHTTYLWGCPVRTKDRCTKYPVPLPGSKATTLRSCPEPGRRRGICSPPTQPTFLR